MKRKIFLLFVSLLLLLAVLSACATDVPQETDGTTGKETNTMPIAETPHVSEEISSSEELPLDSTFGTTEADPTEKKPISQLPPILEVTSPFWLFYTLEEYESPKVLSALPVRDSSLEALFAVPRDGSDARIESLSDLQEKIGIDYLVLKERTFDVAYTITKFYDEDLKMEKYVYCQFESMIRRDENQIALDEQWVLCGQYVLSRRLSMADVALLEIGDPLSKLADVDPAFKKALCASPSLIFTKRLSLILDGGLVEITCDSNSETGETCIQTIQRIASAGDYTPIYDPILSQIPLPDVSVPEDSNDQNLPMSQFPLIPSDATVGWLEATIKKFVQPSLEELPIRTQSDIEFRFGRLFENNAGVGNNYYWDLANFQMRAGAVDFIMQLDKTHVCTVTRIADAETGVEKYVYCVFEQEITGNKSDRELWNNVTEYYFVSRELSSGDFAEISIGDSITRLLAIEPAIQRIYGAPAIIADNFLLLLEDGLMQIQTNASYDPENPIYITGIDFHPYGESVTIKERLAFMSIAPVRPPLPEAESNES